MEQVGSGEIRSKPPGSDRRRVSRLSAAVAPGSWVVFPADPEAEWACVAAPSAAGPVFAAVGEDPIPAVRRLAEAGWRERVHLAAAHPVAAAHGWRWPIGLLGLPAALPHLRAVLAAWAPHVVAGGYVVFVGGRAPRPAQLGLRPEYWTARPRGGKGVVLLVRRPFG
jgi:hypothetical protein